MVIFSFDIYTFRKELIGALLLNVKCGDDRRRVGDACVTFLLGLFRRRSIGAVRRIAAPICADAILAKSCGADLRRRSAAPICAADRRRRIRNYQI